MTLAPLDPGWTIWATSPAVCSWLLTKGREIDAVFEIHAPKPRPDNTWNEYLKWLRTAACPVYMLQPREDYPSSVAFPVDEMRTEFGPTIFTGTPPVALALAITLKPDEIGVWGVDCATTEEWAGQRPAMQHLIWEARRRGIKVTIPPESDLDKDAPLYGFNEEHPITVKFRARMAELRGRETNLAREIEDKTHELMFIRGAIDDAEYWGRTWL